MNKQNELTKEQRDEKNILIANVMDKVRFVKERSGFENTFFLDLAQIYELTKFLEMKHIENYEFFGGFENAERKMLILYSEEMFEYIKDKMDVYNQIMSCIKIELPKGQEEKYEHKTYLGALIKLGLKREMIGDIIVKENGAEILIAKEIEKFLLSNLNLLTRFQKAKISTIKIEEVTNAVPKTKKVKINVSSMRLDSIVSELAHTSREKAQGIIDEERVFVNFKEELSYSKKIEEENYISIRGKGRFKITEIIGQTKSGRLNIEIETFA